MLISPIQYRRNRYESILEFETNDYKCDSYILHSEVLAMNKKKVLDLKIADNMVLKMNRTSNNPETQELL